MFEVQGQSNSMFEGCYCFAFSFFFSLFSLFSFSLKKKSAMPSSAPKSYEKSSPAGNGIIFACGDGGGSFGVEVLSFLKLCEDPPTFPCRRTCLYAAIVEF